MPEPAAKPAGTPFRRRALWFVGIYAASLVGFVAVVYLLRALVPF